jgi:hypothetical protein
MTQPSPQAPNLSALTTKTSNCNEANNLLGLYAIFVNKIKEQVQIK